MAKLVPDLGKASEKSSSGPKQHPKFPNFSDAISVQYDPNGVRGRYCVASRDIEPGELVAVETPFVWMRRFAHDSGRRMDLLGNRVQFGKEAC